MSMVAGLPNWLWPRMMVFAMQHITTVCGPVAADELGITLCHEHIFVDISVTAQEAIRRCDAQLAEDPRLRSLLDTQVSVANLDDVRRYQNLCKDNLVLSDMDQAQQELDLYRNHGGRSIVEVTPPTIGRDPLRLKEVAQRTGLHIVCATGWYSRELKETMPDFGESTAQDLADIMVRELTTGIGETGVCAGVIGELGCGDDRVLEAGAIAQGQTGRALTIHPGRRVPQYLDLLKSAGANMEKVYVSHMDGRYNPLSLPWEISYHKHLMDSYGVTLGYDGFGTYDNIYRNDYYPDSLAATTSDRERVERIAELVDAGYGEQIVISQDVCKKYHWTAYGGAGYAHIGRHIIPALRRHGLADREIDTLLVQNPRRLLSH